MFNLDFGLAAILAVSLIVSIFLWARIIRLQLSIKWKIILMLVVTIPVVGPAMFCFMDPPSRLPANLQAPPLSWGTRPYTEIAQWIRRQKKANINKK